VTRVAAAGEDKKFAVFGALDYASGRVTWHVSAQKGEQAFLAFLDHLAETLPADVPTIIVLDNVGYHKSHALRARWQALSHRFFPFWLPAYAPQLNLIERVWRFLKAKLSNHRWWNDLGRLREATQTLLDLLEVRFHTDDGPAFRLRQDFCSSA
jgi:DDE superfamily endonuclease